MGWLAAKLHLDPCTLHATGVFYSALVVGCAGKGGRVWVVIFVLLAAQAPRAIHDHKDGKTTPQESQQEQLSQLAYPILAPGKGDNTTLSTTFDSTRQERMPPPPSSSRRHSKCVSKQRSALHHLGAGPCACRYPRKGEMLKLRVSESSLVSRHQI